MAGTERIFSGIQPTGRKHLGNYIGAIRQYVEGQNRGEAIYCIVDLHAITVPYEPAELREHLYDTTAILLAAGLDPERCILFRQSDVVEHTELCWLLGTVTAWGDLNRMHQFKEKAEQQRELVSAGLFFYPVLQAADVLAYRATEVPVGDDQRQHIELLAVVRGVAPEEVEREFDGSGYGDFKSAVADALVQYLAPVRERYAAVRADEAALEATLAAGAEKARVIAAETLADVRDAVGIGPA